MHDEAIAAAYCSKDAEIEQLKADAVAEWQKRGRKAVPDLALMTKADLHGDKSELKVGRETLLGTQNIMQNLTGSNLLTDESKQLLVLSVSFREASRERSF